MGMNTIYWIYLLILILENPELLKYPSITFLMVNVFLYIVEQIESYSMKVAPSRGFEVMIRGCGVYFGRFIGR